MCIYTATYTQHISYLRSIYFPKLKKKIYIEKETAKQHIKEKLQKNRVKKFEKENIRKIKNKNENVETLTYCFTKMEFKMNY